ncbi:hypothetical protein Pedsa_0736 [Pseudopedobacter saltans DSM 12145]|uniref:Carbohydrate-binding domain-containing protein n=1 Tax=Pseudopedobacter saltans (strain ATCC 51119 / DSM 12145 / JCM 21818 / CCUG 39354 / LMG 10337 / NBRC 100064 / NCIMB 13643) TaxID=762903 RepID=F0S8M8_PSESL|nr:carbohydrate-binding family 9-like protein [Pseudopedobacter saltans]ADY51312.1 hypothetical protein Pedsa_0736 [Pseudopedobacter saltans DSM 12145]
MFKPENIDLHTDQKEQQKEFIQTFIIDNQPWISYQEQDVFANVELSFDNDFLYLNFTSMEKQVKAKYRDYNGKVHEDSCFEFFVRFDEDSAYYNLEVNIIGSIKLAYGKERFSRQFLPIDILKNIERDVFIIPLLKDDTLYIESTLNLKIPAKTFVYNKVTCLQNHKLFGNFYKCGGSLEKPHYLSWNHIVSDNPDFHRPEFFKLINVFKEI